MRFLLSIVALAVGWTGTARAQGTSEAIVAYTNAFAGLFSVTVGWTFQPTTFITVTELGCFTNFFANNPTATQIRVGLWAYSGSVLASNVVTSTSAVFDASRFESITPVALDPGTTYNIGVFFGGGTFSLATVSPGANPNSFATTSPELTLIGAARGSGGFGFPAAEPNTPGAAYLGPNFRYQGRVPEPSSWLLLSLGGVLLAAGRRAHRR